jgi:hypothetical protein
LILLRFDLAMKEKRPIGLTRNTGWQIGARRTHAISSIKLWEHLLSPEGQRIWLGEVGALDFTSGGEYHLSDGTRGKLTTLRDRSHFRLTWQPSGWTQPSVLQIRVVPKGDRSVLALHQEHLPDQQVRQDRREAFLRILDDFEAWARGKDS